MTATTVSEQQQLELFTGYPVKIEIFAGPLDLLVHLVKRQELDIYEVEIAQITSQYLDYLATMQMINIGLAGDFLVMAARLMYIKSRRLLPPTASPDDEEEPDEAQLVAQLRRRVAQYQAYKQAAEALQQARQLRQQIYLRPLDEDSTIPSGFVQLDDISIFDMVGAVRRLLQQAEPEPPAVPRPELTIADGIEQVVSKLCAAESSALTFSDLVGIPVTRTIIIFVFLAVLELIRRGEVRVRQNRPGDEIMVELNS